MKTPTTPDAEAPAYAPGDPGPRAEPAVAHAPHQVSRHTTPTWEMELLISGLTVFALLQLPGELDRWLAAIMTRFEAEWQTMVLLFYVYVKFAVVALIGTFILHLSARGYWVALVGMRSVFPDGMRWDRLRGGPIYRDYAMRSTPSQESRIERADDRASIVFGVGVGLAFLMLVPLLLVTIGFVLALALSWAFGLREQWSELFFGAVAVMVLPLLVATLVDRLRGARLDPAGLPARVIRGIYRLYGRVGMGRYGNSLLAVFYTQVGPRRASTAVSIVTLLVMLAIMVGMEQQRGTLDIGNYTWLPPVENAATRTVDPQRYASLSPVRTGIDTDPYIQSEIVRDPYLRLFVPYLPTRLNAAIPRRCPGVDPTLSKDAALEEARLAAVLECVATLHPVTLDGKPVADLRYDIHADATTGVRGFLAMIPVHDLARGRHELGVMPAPRSKTRAKDPPLRPVVIPFWR